MKELDWSAVIEAHEALLSHPDLDAGFVGFRRDLAKAYAKTSASLAGTTDADSSPAEMGDSFPRLAAENVPLDPALLDSLFHSVQSSLEEHGAQGEEVTRLKDGAGEEADLIRRITRLAVFDWDGTEIKEISRRLEVTYGGLLYLGRLLAVPFLHDAVRRLGWGRPEPDAEAHANCPSCGAPPALARLVGEGGNRILVCTLCDTHWHYPRVQCPFCKNTKQDSLGVLFPEDDPAHRIEICEECKRYLKTVDERALGHESLAFFEETRTLPLDLLAAREGYVRRLY